MSDVVFVAMIGAVPATVAALASWRSSIRNGRKADEIHLLVNGRMEKVVADLALANQRIELLLLNERVRKLEP